MSRTRSRRLVVAAALLAATVIALAGWWAYDRFTLSAAERNLVGTWAQTRDGGADLAGVLVEHIVREDRTVLLENRDAKTGAVISTHEMYAWWGISDGLLTLRYPRELRPGRWYAWWDRPGPYLCDELRLAPDGPDRVRYTLVRCDRMNADLRDPLPSGVWTRVKAE